MIPNGFGDTAIWETMCALLCDSEGSFGRPKAQELTSRLINQKYFNLVQKYMWKVLEI